MNFLFLCIYLLYIAGLRRFRSVPSNSVMGFLGGPKSGPKINDFPYRLLEPKWGPIFVPQIFEFRIENLKQWNIEKQHRASTRAQFRPCLLAPKPLKFTIQFSKIWSWQWIQNNDLFGSKNRGKIEFKKKTICLTGSPIGLFVERKCLFSLLKISKKKLKSA